MAVALFCLKLTRARKIEVGLLLVLPADCIMTSHVLLIHTLPEGEHVT